MFSPLISDSWGEKPVRKLQVILKRFEKSRFDKSTALPFPNKFSKKLQIPPRFYPEPTK